MHRDRLVNGRLGVAFGRDVGGVVPVAGEGLGIVGGYGSANRAKDGRWGTLRASVVRWDLNFQVVVFDRV